MMPLISYPQRQACRCLTVLLFASFPTLAPAATLFWDTVSDGAAITGGTGTWTNALGNWNTGSGDTTWSNATPDDASFGETAGTVTLGGAVTVADMTFNTPGYTIAGGGNILTLSDSTITANADATISSVVAGTTGLIKTGAGTLTLSEANTYTGTTTINAGTLQLGDGGTKGQLGSGAITNNGSLVVNRSDTTATISAVISGTGSLTQAGTGMLSLNSGNSYTGATIISGGTLFTAVLANGGSNSNIGASTNVASNLVLDGGILRYGGANTTTNRLFSIGTGGGTFNLSATINFTNTGSMGFNGQSGARSLTFGTNAVGTTILAAVIGDNGGATSLTKSGTGTLALTGNSIYTGITTISAGTLNLGNSSSSGSVGSGDIINNGTLILARFTGFNLSQTISGTGGITINAGTHTLSGTNTYTGVTTINAGLNLLVSTIGDGGVASNLGAASNAAGNIVLAGNGALNFVGTGSVNNTDRLFSVGVTGGVLAAQGTGAINFTNTGSMGFNGFSGARTLTLTGTNTGNNSLAAAIGDNGGATALTKSGAGKWLLTGTNTYSGTTTISGGVLQVGNGGTTGTLGSGGVTNNSSLVINRSDAITLSNAISGTGTVTQAGAGTTILAGANSYSGSTTISAGVLQIGNGSTTGTLGTNTVNNNARLSFNRSDSIAVSNLISGSGGVSQIGVGTTTLSGVNSYTGVTTVSGGVLSVSALANGGASSNIGASTSAAVNLVLDGGTLKYTGGAGSTDRLFSVGTSGGTLDSSGSLGLTFTNVGSMGFNGQTGSRTLTLAGTSAYSTNVVAAVIGDNGGATSLVKDGTGVWTLTADNTYSGTTTINAGNLAVGANGTSGSLGTGDIVNNGWLHFRRSDAVTLAQTISGAGNFFQGGGGTVTLTGNNTYTGTTSLAGLGTVSVSSLGDGGSASGIGAAGSSADNILFLSVYATLRYTGAATSTDRLFTIGLGAGAILDASGSGAIQFTNTGSIVVTPGGSTNKLTLTGTNTGNNSLAAILGDSSVATSLAKSGVGTWVLGGDSTYTGATTISAGTLGVSSLADGGNASNIGASSNAATNLVFNGGTLKYTGGAGSTDRLFSVGTSGGRLDASGTGAINFTNTGSMGFNSQSGTRTLTLTGTNTGDNTLAAVIGNSGSTTSLTKSGTGTWVLTGANSYSGPTTINAGVLQIGGGGITGSLGGGSVINNASLVFDRSDAVSISNTISGTGSLVQAGSGTTTLAGSNNYTGATVINAGVLKVTLMTNGGIAGNIGAASNAATNLVLDGGTLQFTGVPTSTDRLFSVGTAGGTLDSSGTGAWNFTNTGSMGFNGESGARTLTLAGTNSVLVDNTMALVIGDNGGATSVTRTGGGSSVLSGTNTYTGVTTVSGTAVLRVTTLADGGLASGMGASSNSAANLVLDGGTFKYSGGTASTDRLFTVTTNGGTLDSSGGSPLSFTNAGSMGFGGQSGARTLTLAGVNGAGASLAAAIGDNGGATSLDKTGAGTWSLTGASTYTGPTTIAAGTLIVSTLANGGSSSSIGSATSAAANLVLNGGTLKYTGGAASTDRLFSIGTSGGSLDASGTGAVNFTNTGSMGFNGQNGARTLTLTGSHLGLNKIAAVIDDNGGATSLTKTGTGKWVLTGANTYSGTTTISSGVLQIGDNSAGGTFGVGNIVNNAALVLYRSDTYTVSQVISGTGNVSMAGGTSVATLSGLSTYTGFTSISAGTLSVDTLADGGVASSIGASTNAATKLQINGGTLKYTGAGASTDRLFSVGVTAAINASGTGALNFTHTGSMGLLFTSARTLTLTGTSADDNTLAAAITDNSGATSLVKSGTGTWILTGVNTYAGTTTINDGTLQIGNGGTSGTIGTGSITNNGTLVIDRSAAISISASMSGSGDFIQNGGGTTTLTGSNQWGSATVNAGRLVAGSTSAIGSLSAMTVNSGGTLVIKGLASSAAVGSLSGSGVVENGGTTAQTLAILGSSSGSTTFSGTIQDGGTGSMSIVKLGSSYTLALTGDSTYTGATQVSSGTLSVTKLANGGNASSVGASSNAAANLFINRTGTLSYTGSGSTTDRLFTIATGISSTLDASGTGAVNFTNTGAVGLSNSGTRVFKLSGTNTDDNTLAAVIGDSGGATALSKLGVGKWVLTGSNTYTGTTTISAGTLQIGDGGTTGALGSGALDNSGTFIINRSNAVAQGTDFSGASISGVGAFKQVGSGTTTLNAANTYTGATTVSGGGLTLAGTASLGNTAITVSNAGTAFTVLAGSGSVNAGFTGAGTAGARLSLGAGTVFSMQDGAVGAFNLQQQSSFGAAGTALTISGATLNFDLSSSGSDLLAVSVGKAVVSGTNIIGLNLLGSSLTNGTYNLITANQGLSGTFQFDTGLTKQTVNLGGTAYALSLINSATAQQVNVSTPVTLTWTGQTFGNGVADSSWNDSGSSNWANGSGAGSVTNYVNGVGVTFQDLNTVTAANVTNVTITIQAVGVSPTSVLFNNSTVNYTVDNASGTVGITGTTGLTKQGTGTVTLSSANTYTGATTITSGTLQVNGSIAAGSTVGIGTAGTLSGSGTINGDVTLTGAGIINLTNPGIIGGTLGVTGGNWNGAGSVTGLVTSSSGTFTIDAGANLTANGGLSVNGGSIASGNSASTITGSMIYTSAANSTFNGVIAGNAKTVTMNSAGATLILGGVNTYTGATTITAGTLQVNGSLDAGSAVGVGTGATLSGSGTVNGTSDVTSGTINGTGLILTGLTTFNGTGNILSGSETATAGVTLAAGAAVTQSGTLTGNLNTTNTGTFTANGAVTGNATVAAGGTLAGSGSIGGTTGVTSGTINGTGLILTGVTTFNSSGNVLSGTVTSTNGVTLASAAELALNGALTGNLTVGAGTLTGAGGSISGNASLNGGIINLTSGTVGTLSVTGGNWNGAGSVTGLATSSSGIFTVGSGANLTANGGLSVTGGSIASTDATSTITGSVNYTSASNSTFSGVIAGSGKTLTLNHAAATLILDGANTYTGATTITAGTLQLGSGGTTGTLSSSSVITNNGTFEINRSNAVVQGTDFNGAGISGTGGITQAGTGTTTLNATNTYTGATLVSAGTLQLGSTGALGDAGAHTSGVTVNNGAALDLNGVTATANTVGLNLNGTSTATAGALTNSNGTAATWAGTVTLQSASSIGSNSGDIVLSGDITGGFGLTKVGSDKLTLTGATNGSTTTTINAGTLEIGNGGTSGALGSGLVVNNGNLTINRSDAFTIGATNAISGTGSFTQAGDGTTTFTGANSYSGATTINAGTLEIATGGSLDGTSSVTLNNGRLLISTSTDNVVNSGTPAAFTVGAGGGTLSLADALSGNTQTFGALTVGGAFNVNFGTGNTNSVVFDSVGGIPPNTILVSGWTGTVYEITDTIDNGSLTQDRLLFNNDPGFAANTALTAFTFTNDAGALIGRGLQVTLGGQFEIVAVADPDVFWNSSVDSSWGAGTATTSNWYTTAAGMTTATLPGSGTTVHMTANSASSLTTTLDGSYSIRGIIFSGAGTAADSGNVTIANGTGVNVLTIGTGGITDSSTSAAHTISANIALNGNQTWSNASSGVLTISCSTITGTGNLIIDGAGNTDISAAIQTGVGTLTKNGTGTLTLSGLNTYTGLTTVNDGELDLNTTGGLAISGDVTVGDTIGAAGSAILKLLQSDQIVTTAAVIVNSDGEFALNGSSNAVASLNSNGGRITSTVPGGNLTVTAGPAFSGTGNLIGSGATVTSSVTATLAANGSLAINGTLADSLTIASGSTLTGSGGVNGTTGVTSATINGGGLTLTGVTTFNSSGNILGGTVTSTNGVVLASSAALELNGALTGNLTVGDGTLTGTGSVSGTTGVTGGTINGTGLTLTDVTTFNGSGNVLSGTVTSTNGVTLASSSALELNGALTGNLMVGDGTLTGTGGSISGNASLNGGIINLTSGTIGTLSVTGGNWNGAGSVMGTATSSSGTFTIGSGADLTADGGLDVTGGSIASADATSTITGSVSYTSASNSTFSGVIAGTGKTVTLNNAAATLTLDGANTYTGMTTITAGTLSTVGGALAGTTAIEVNGGILNAVDYNSLATLTLNSTGTAAISGSNLSLAAVSNANTTVNSLTFTATTGTTTLSSLTGAGDTHVTNDLTISGIFDAGSLTVDGVAAIGTMSGGIANFNGATSSITTLNGGTVNLAMTELSVSDGTTSDSITGGGSLIKISTGTLTLNGANTYAGITTVRAGTLAVSSTGSLNSGNDLTVEAAGTATFANVGQNLGAVGNANTTTDSLHFTALTGTITMDQLSGVGSTTFDSDATITTSGISDGTIAVTGLLTSDISGGTVNAGSLIADSINGGTNIVTGTAGITTVDGGATTVGGVATVATLTSGVLNLNGTASAITTLNGGTVNLGTTVLTISGGTSSGTITGANGSVVKNTTDVLTLANANTYGGTTDVNAGALVVNGALTGGSTVTVAAGAVLAGDGGAITTAINQSVFLNGVLSVGDPNLAVRVPSVFSITTSGTGGIIMGVGSSLALDIFTTTGVADMLNLTGTLDATAGGTLVIGNPNMLAVSGGDQWQVVDLNGGAGSIIGTLALDDSSLRLTSNQVANFDHTSGLFKVIDVSSGLQIAGAQDQVVMSSVQGLLSDVGGRLSNFHSGGGEESVGGIGQLLDEGVIEGEGDGSEEGPVVKKVLPSRKWEVFTTVNTANARLSTIGTQPGVKSTTWAPGFGIERHVSNHVAVGLAMSLLESHQTYTSGLGTLEVEGVAASAYASYVSSSYWVDVLYSFGRFDLDSERNATGFPVAIGSTTAWTHAVQLNGGWKFRFQDNTLITGPFVGVDYLNVGVDGYSETGGGIGALAYGSRSMDSLVTRIGWSVSKRFETDIGSISAQLRLSYERQNISNNNGTSVNLINQPFAATSNSRSPGQDYLVAGAGLHFQLSPTLSMQLNYQGQFFRQNLQAHFVGIRFSYAF